MNKWEKSDSDSDSDSDIEDPVSDLHPIFVEQVNNIKHKIYEHIVMEPILKTKKAQDIRLLNQYRLLLQKLYNASIQAQNGQIFMLGYFPIHLKELIHQLLEWIQDFFKKNSLVDTVPYEFYLKQSLLTFPYIQNNSFMRKE